MEHERQFLPIIRQFREERCVFRETRGSECPLANLVVPESGRGQAQSLI